LSNNDDWLKPLHDAGQAANGEGLPGIGVNTLSRATALSGTYRGIPAAVATSLRTLLIDIEVAPSIVAVWGPNRDPVVYQDAVLHQQRIICFSYKWYGDKGVTFVSERQESSMASVLQELFTEADVIVHYYGKQHDVPHINTMMLTEGLTPPSPYKQVDLCEVVKRHFRFEYNSLSYVSKQLGLSGKNDRIGIANWLGCMQGSEESWAIMEEYSKQDVLVLEELYDQLRPWIPSHPSRAAYDEQMVCPLCGHTDLERRGFSYTTVSKFQRYQCKNCGKWSRGSRSLNTVKIREAVN
jgi:DNA polymerase elongation subunit (family B)/predicted RNA-binding Zn-ribbon protein involved in translation (DUF1610 family)